MAWSIQQGFVLELDEVPLGKYEVINGYEF